MIVIMASMKMILFVNIHAISHNGRALSWAIAHGSTVPNENTLRYQPAEGVGYSILRLGQSGSIKLHFPCS